MWRVTAGNGLPRCEGYRWARFGLLGSSFGGGLAVSGRVWLTVGTLTVLRVANSPITTPWMLSHRGPVEHQPRQNGLSPFPAATRAR